MQVVDETQLEQSAVASVSQLVAASHDELKPVTFAALIAADVHAASVGNNFEIPDARLVTPAAVGVEDVGVLGGNALHAFI
jgi:hypothetical protein